MLTPSFTLTQTEEQIVISIHAPYTQLNDVEINALDSQLWFYSSPYFLRLTFPKDVVDDDEPPTSFNADTGNFEIQLSKQNRGEHFPDLDLLGTLLAPRKQQQNLKPSIEVISGETEQVDSDEEDPDEWLINQELPVPVTGAEGPFNAPKYGFGNQCQGVFQQVKSEFIEIVDLKEPDLTPACQRDILRLAEENQHFCPDHYLADLMEPGVVEEVMAFCPSWQSLTPDLVKLSGEEREALKKLGNKEFLLTKEDKSATWLSLVDIVFAYAYNHRTTLGEDTVESAWTVNKLSATLSWFTIYSSIHNVVVTCFRRLLTYSLYRNWDLAQLVLKDTISILKLGRRQVLKCLLNVHQLFTTSEPRYLLNQLYITDYCIWLQRVSDQKLKKLVAALDQVSVTKQDMGFELEELEEAALLAVQEEEQGLTSGLANLDINTADRRSSSSSTISDTDSESESCDSSSTLDSDDDSSPES